MNPHLNTGFDCELKLPNTIKKIGAGAFQMLYGLKGELKLPDSLESIEERVFSGEDIECGTNVFPNDQKVEVPSEYQLDSFCGINLTSD